MNPTFWKEKSVLVTGHTGFKGSWLCLWLQLLGARTSGFALPPPTNPSLYKICGIGRNMNSIVGDVRDQEAVITTLREVKPEIVFHMAAQPIVRESYVDPVMTYATNVLGTVHLLDAIRKAPGIKAVVIVTSDKCYENREWYWSYREKSMLGGDDPYSSSKACVEIVTNAFRKSFFNPEHFGEHGVAVASARAGNVIAGGDWAQDRLVPDIMRALMDNRPIVVRNPHATRPWQHVLDPLNGYLTLAEALYDDGPRCVGAWNFGPYDFNDKTVGWIVEQLCQIWGATFKWERDQRSNPHENIYLKLDSSKARSLLNWTPRINLPTALAWIVAWTKAYQAGAEMRGTTEAQVLEFMEMKEAQPAASFSSCSSAVAAGSSFLDLSADSLAFTETIASQALLCAQFFI